MTVRQIISSLVVFNATQANREAEARAWAVSKVRMARTLDHRPYNHDLALYPWEERAREAAFFAARRKGDA